MQARSSISRSRLRYFDLGFAAFSSLPRAHHDTQIGSGVNSQARLHCHNGVEDGSRHGLVCSPELPLRSTCPPRSREPTYGSVHARDQTQIHRRSCNKGHALWSRGRLRRQRCRTNPVSVIARSYLSFAANSSMSSEMTLALGTRCRVAALYQERWAERDSKQFAMHAKVLTPAVYIPAVQTICTGGMLGRAKMSRAAAVFHGREVIEATRAPT